MIKEITSDGRKGIRTVQIVANERRNVGKLAIPEKPELLLLLEKRGAGYARGTTPDAKDVALEAPSVDAEDWVTYQLGSND